MASKIIYRRYTLRTISIDSLFISDRSNSVDAIAERQNSEEDVTSNTISMINSNDDATRDTRTNSTDVFAK